MRKNKIIFDSMKLNYYEIQKKKFSEYLKKIEEKDNFNKIPIKKIKITNVVPKNNQHQENEKSFNENPENEKSKKNY